MKPFIIAPFIIIAELAALSGIFFLLSYPEDLIFYTGIISLFLFLLINYLLINKFVK